MFACGAVAFAPAGQGWELVTDNEIGLRGRTPIDTIR